MNRSVVPFNTGHTWPGYPMVATTESPLFFPVELVPAYARRGHSFHEAPEHQAVIRTDTNEVLAVHGPGYKLVTHQEVYAAFDDALEQSNLDLNGMSFRDEISHNGARSLRTYVFPEHSMRIGRNDDVVDLQLRVVNSYDGSAAFSAIVGAYRLVCTNGLVIGNKWAETYSKHTEGFDLESILRKLSGALDAYCQHAELWQRWTGKTLAEYQAKAIIEVLPGSSDKLKDTLLAYYLRETYSLGPTLWALYNALTYWSTHEKVKSSSTDNLASIVLNRENRVRSLLNSNEFLKLAA